MDNNRFYEISNYIGTFLYVLMIILVIIGSILNRTLLRFSAYVFIIIGVYGIWIHIYFKKSSIIRGVSPTSKIQILGTISQAGLCFYFAYYILAHFT